MTWPAVTPPAPGPSPTPGTGDVSAGNGARRAATATSARHGEDMARRLVAAGAAQVAPPVMTPWGDRNARVQAPDGMQLTLFTAE